MINRRKKMLRKVFGLVNERRVWGIRRNYKLRTDLKSPPDTRYLIEDARIIEVWDQNGLGKDGQENLLKEARK
jgi:hypothetical protein